MIYLDHAATSFPKPERVLDAMLACARTAAANPGRSGHRMSVEAAGLVEETRRALARFFAFPRPERVIFTLNATDALNMAIKGVLKPGDHVITSVLEHNSVSRPLNRLERDGVITLTRLEAGDDHRVDPEAITRAFRPQTRLVALAHASNVTGTLQPVEDVGRIVREHEALLLVDAAQSAGVVPLDMVQANIDLLAFAGHKGLQGPMGTGGLVVGERADAAPWREGGTGGDSADTLHPLSYPHRLEGGTPNVMGLAGLREGVRVISEKGLETILPRERRLLACFMNSLKDSSRYNWHGSDTTLANRAGVGLLGFTVPGLAPAEVAAILDGQFGIAVRAGLHCAPYAHRHLGTFPDGTVRLSVGLATTEAEMQAAASALDEVAGGV